MVIDAVRLISRMCI